MKFLQDQVVIPKESEVLLKFFELTNISYDISNIFIFMWKFLVVWLLLRKLYEWVRPMREGPLCQQVRQFFQFTYSIIAQAGFFNSRVQDLIGLRTLDECGAVAFESYDGNHCQFSDEWFAYMIRK